MSDHTFSKRPASVSRKLLDVGLPSILVIVSLFLALYNLEHYPRTWFDEGSYLHVPKSLAVYGRYADYSSEGFRYDGPATGTGVGPTVIVPIALAFKVFGVGLLQARLVMVVYLLFTLGTYYLLANHLFGRTVALVSTSFLLGSPGIAFMQLGRQALGEVPAFGFFLAGCLLWFSAFDRGQPIRLLLSGVALGLAMSTKSHYALIVPPALLLLWAFDRWRQRRIRGRYIVGPLATGVGTFGLWYVFQLLYLGPVELLANVQRTSAASSGAIFLFSPARILTGTRFLFSPELLYGWTIPALVYVLVKSASTKNPTATKQAALSIFVLMWLSWYVLASIAWPRYAFPAAAVSAMFVASLLVDVGRGIVDSNRGLRVAFVGDGRALAALCVTLAIPVMALYPLQEVARTTAAEPDRSPQEFASLLASEVDENSIIETWEPELGFLTDHRYHYPPNVLLVGAVRQKWIDPETEIVYDARAANPDYLALGRFGKWTGVYARELASGDYAHVASVGEYDLYRLISSKRDSN